MDPLVSLDGSEKLPVDESTTAGRIVADGGSAEASAVSVTDRDGVEDLFGRLVEQHGGLDAVVNAAGITRPTGIARGSEEDWRAVLEVHLDGYRNVLGAALPHMAEAAAGRILGVTSGSGWRRADAGAYACAKRAVAALTWQLGGCTHEGVVVNAISPIALTRMVTAALGRTPRDGGGTGSTGSSRPPGRSGSSGRSGPSGSAATGGLSLSSLPAPEDMGPLGAHLVLGGSGAYSGHVLFACGSEVAVVEPPRLLEAIRTDGVVSVEAVLEGVTEQALVAAEAQQATTGGGNPRFGDLFGQPGVADPPAPAVRTVPAVRTAAVVTDRPAFGAALVAALDARGVTGTVLHVESSGGGFAGAAAELASAERRIGGLDALIVALAGPPPATRTGDAWAAVLAEHDGIVDRIHADAAWARAVADLSAGADRPMRLVTLTDACTSGGRSRAQAAAQLARAAGDATGGRVTATAVSVEAAWEDHAKQLAALGAHLAVGTHAGGLSGAELVAGPGWFGLRSHPRPAGSIVFGGPGLPDWFDEVLGQIVGYGARP
jgi:NAD(P)-dependent dehydrogenase (short-subunit alcohol dehydrogenase family)